MGTEGIYTHTFVYEQKENCPVCTASIRKVTMAPTATLGELLQTLVDGDLRLKKPSIVSSSDTLYMQAPPALEAMTRPNLDKPLSDLIDSGEELTITDPVFPGSKSLGLCVTLGD